VYELKKNGKLFTSKFVGTGPSSYIKKKKNLPGSGLTKVEKHWCRNLVNEEALAHGGLLRQKRKREER